MDSTILLKEKDIRFSFKNIWANTRAALTAKSSGEFVPATGSVVDNGRQADYPVPHQNKKGERPHGKRTAPKSRHPRKDLGYPGAHIGETGVRSVAAT